MRSVIWEHNWQKVCWVEEIYGCNCRVKTGYQLQNTCVTLKVAYENEAGEELKIYHGLAEGTFIEKPEFNNHLGTKITWKTN